MREVEKSLHGGGEEALRQCGLWIKKRKNVMIVSGKKQYLMIYREYIAMYTVGQTKRIGKKQRKR